MDERDFELLFILKETKNITKAADLLYVTQSSLSKRISALEEELDTTLILRSRSGIVFTPEGEIVLEHTARAAEELKIMRESVNAGKGYVCGTLNAGISVNYALYRFPDILTTYRKQYPHVTTHITTGHSRKLYAQMLDDVIDIAILRGEYPWKGNRLLLEREKVCAVFHEEYKEKSLAEIPYMGRKTDAAFEREILQWLRENDLNPELRGIYVDSITTCVEMVNRGIGWAIVPEICLHDFQGIIKPLVFKNGEPFVRSTYLMYTDRAALLPQVKAFIDIVKEYNSKGV